MHSMTGLDGAGRLAALDLGTNSFHLVVAELTDSGSLRTITTEKEMLRLGDAVAATGRIGRERADASVLAIHRLLAIAQAQGAATVVAAATAAIREAVDGADFVDRIEDECDLDVQVISGEREAQLIFRAVQASVDFGGEHAMAIDIGGGSVEFMIGDQGTVDFVGSLRLGVGRLTAQFVHSDPLDATQRRALDRYVRTTLATVAAEAELYPYRMGIGTSGTLLALARITAAGRVDDRHLDGFRVDVDELLDVCRTLTRSSAEERSRIPGLEPRRADLMPAAGVLVRAIVETLGLDTIAFSTWGLREGLLLREIQHPVLSVADPARMRARSTLALGRRHGFDELHGRQTARLAATLFDQLAPALKLDVADRDLLLQAAMIHDVGNSIARKGHHRHGAYLVWHGELAGFEPDDRALLAALVRYHRSGTPRPGVPEFDVLDDHGKTVLAPLSAILRIADGLDSSRHANVLGLDAAVRGDEIVIRLKSTSGDPGLDLWGARRKAGLLEEVSGRNVAILGPDEIAPRE